MGQTRLQIEMFNRSLQTFASVGQFCVLYIYVHISSSLHIRKLQAQLVRRAAQPFSTRRLRCTPGPNNEPVSVLVLRTAPTYDFNILG